MEQDLPSIALSHFVLKIYRMKTIIITQTKEKLKKIRNVIVLVRA